MLRVLVAGLAIVRLGGEEEFDPDSYVKFDSKCYSEWIMIMSLMHELEAIY